MRPLACVLIVLVLSAPPAGADPPTVGTSTIGTFVRLGTTDDAGVVLPAAEKLVTIRDLGGTPVAGAMVEIDFGTCGGGEVELCATQPFPDMGFDCTTARVFALTDDEGVARFRVCGHALNPGGGGIGAPAPGWGDSPCATVRADGVALGMLRVKTYDQDGVDGIGPIDLSLLLNDRFGSSCAPYPRPPCDTYRSRSDLNDDGRLDVADLALFLQARFAAFPQRSCSGGSVCTP